MINYNGEIIDSTAVLSANNRSFLYGDGVFETLKIVDNKILFWEDHYFRLMAAMRIVRMQIPSDFTSEYLETQVLQLVALNGYTDAARIRLTVFRNEGGYYLPQTRTVSYLIQAAVLTSKKYFFTNDSYEVDLYKDFVVTKQLLSTLKTTNKMIHVTGSIFADENNFQNCLLLNTDKSVVEALNGNIFMLLDGKLITPPLEEGCLNGIIRKQILYNIKAVDGIQILEMPISPFDLQKADELFITNVITGIQPITKYRKKMYETAVATQIMTNLNALI